MTVSTHNLTSNHALAVCSLESACMDLHSDIRFFVGFFVLFCCVAAFDSFETGLPVVLSLLRLLTRVALYFPASASHLTDRALSLQTCIQPWVPGLILRPSYLPSKRSTYWATPVLRSLLICSRAASQVHLSGLTAWCVPSSMASLLSCRLTGPGSRETRWRGWLLCQYYPKATVEDSNPGGI